jgi:hypothetical protein
MPENESLLIASSIADCFGRICQRQKHATILWKTANFVRGVGVHPRSTQPAMRNDEHLKSRARLHWFICFIVR